MRSTITRDRKNKRLIVERTFPAPQATLWVSWTEPERIAQWWGPAGWSVDILEMDVRPGGLWRYRLHPANPAEDGEAWCRAQYQTVDSPVVLEYVDRFTDSSGAPLNDTETPTSVTFTALGPDRTLVGIVTRFESTEQLDEAEAMGMVSGYDEAFDRLDARLTGTGASR